MEIWIRNNENSYLGVDMYSPNILLMKKFDQLRDLVSSLEDDFTKFYDKGNQAAGTRIRKGMQDLKNMAQEIRTEVQDLKNKA